MSSSVESQQANTPTSSPEQIRCLEQYKAYYANLIMYYAKQHEWVRLYSAIHDGCSGKL